MRTITPIPVEAALPSVRSVLEAQGIPHFQQNNDRTKSLAREAIALYQEKAKSIGILMEVPKEQFAFVFNGEGRNENESPVGPISQASTALALTAVTIGETICKEISNLFQTNDFALGSMLDATASEGTEMTAQLVESLYRKHLEETGRLSSRDGILRFSPGYCGWHISGQKKLFDALRPSEIGISLNESYLMQPLKSISGIIIAGEKHIFYFDDTFSFCRDCADHSCRERIQTIMDQ